MPDVDFIMAPDTVTYSFALEPAYNAANSLVLIDKLDKLSGLDNWVTHTAALMTPQQRHANRLVFIGLHYAAVPDRSYPSFPAYLQALAETPGEVLRDRMLDAYVNIACWYREQEGKPAINRDDLISSLDSYLNYLDTSFPADVFDADIETEAYHLVMDPPALQDLILTHSSQMWDHYLAQEWRRVEPMLQEAVDAFSQLDLAGLPPIEAVSRVYGHEVSSEKWAHWMADFQQFVFVPSAHLGPYKGKFDHGKTIYQLFGARMPEGVTLPNRSALSRSELLVRLNALADETRLRILALVTEAGELCAQDIITRLDLSQSAASRHLQQLSATGYLIERRQENAKCYSLNPARVEDTLDALKGFLGQ